jgi:formylglycine-generating enzyme required for sulfatase activity
MAEKLDQKEDLAWDFFLSHAGADKEDTSAFYELLKLHSTVFLDRRDLTPGCNWPKELLEALGRSLITVVLVSSNTESAYYQNSEILTAIELEREDSARHRVVPVLLDHRSDFAKDAAMDFVMNTKHALSVSELGFSDVVQRLLELLEKMKDTFPVRMSSWDTLLQMLPVAAGPFRMGTKLEDIKQFESYEWCRDWYAKGGNKWEQPSHVLDLPAFKISKYPITNRQYNEFVRAADHQVPEHWHEGIYPPGTDDHPVVYVSWIDANEYCAWLTAKTRHAHRLPTEAEWEKAARGTDGRHWPWGNDWDPHRCNSSASGVQQVVSVTHFGPLGESVYQVADMAGNVAEWCNSKWGHLWNQPTYNYPFDIADGREARDGKDLRITRGGSHRASMGDIRCAARSRYQPDKRIRTLGFRIVC